MLFSLRNEGYSDRCYSMGEPWKHERLRTSVCVDIRTRFSQLHLRVELLGHMVILLNFRGVTVLQSGCALFHSHRQCRRLPGFYILTNTYCLWFEPSWWEWGGVSLWFWFAFPEDWWCWAALLCLAICVSSLKRQLFLSFAHVKNGVIRVLYVFQIQVS